MQAEIVVLPGDGVGPEVMDEAVRVLEAVADLAGHDFSFRELLVGGAAIAETSHPLPEETLRACRTADGVLLAAVGGPPVRIRPNEEPVRPEQGLLGLRRELGVYANLRPVRVYPQLLGASPLRDEQGAGVNLVIVRELTGGLYFGDRMEAGAELTDDTTAYDTMVYQAREVERIAHVGFKLAAKRRRNVVSVDKANVLASSRLWRRVVERTAAAYADVECESMLVDAAAMHLLRRPKTFDVVLTANLFGDILADEASMLVGSLAMLPSASLSDEGPGLFEPVHGSAPDLAGQGVANPIGMILSGAMFLRHGLGLEAEAKTVEEAVERVLDDGWRTQDLAVNGQSAVGTREFGDLVLGALNAGGEGGE